MREHEMRLRVFRFLRARVRNMIMPATVGIGLAVGGCTDSSVKALYMGPMPKDAGPDAIVLNHDAAGGPEVVGPPDSLGADLAQPGRDAQAQADQARSEVSPDTAVALDGVGATDSLLSEAGGHDVMPDLGGMKYIAPFLDAAPGADTIEAPIAKYIAPIPDAAMSDTPAMRYLAQMPDADRADRAMPVYMAPPPAES